MVVAVDGVVADPADEPVVTAATGELVVAVPAVEYVVPVAGGRRLAVAVDGVVAAEPVDRLVAVGALPEIAVVGAGHVVGIGLDHPRDEAQRVEVVVVMVEIGRGNGDRARRGGVVAAVVVDHVVEDHVPAGVGEIVRRNRQQPRGRVVGPETGTERRDRGRVERQAFGRARRVDPEGHLIDTVGGAAERLDEGLQWREARRLLWVSCLCIVAGDRLVQVEIVDRHADKLREYLDPCLINSQN